MFKKIVGLGFSVKGKNAKNINDYVDSLVSGGATEFFTGYNPTYWSDKFGFEVSPNGRFSEHEQITDFETLKSIVERVHFHNLEIFINLNAWYYTDETFPLIEKMIKEFEQINIDGIICGNIGILEYLKEKEYKGKINISTIMAVYNKEAIKFLIENYKINKVILSRELTLKEIEELLNEFIDLKFEVFGEGDFCRYNNGLCFAEHKYGTRDICTVVVNDLIIKKRYRPDFKEIILNENLDDYQKLELLDNNYLDDFEKLEELMDNIELGILKNNLEEITKIILKLSKKPDLYYDPLKGHFDKKNKEIIILLKAIKSIVGGEYFRSEKTIGNEGLHSNDKNLGNENIHSLQEMKDLQKELENQIKKGLTYNNELIKKLGGKSNIQAKEKDLFYNRSGNLNLYSYLFFSKFPNLETVKFPTRGRNNNEKLKIIEETIKNGKVDKNLIDLSIGLDRVHYNLTYLFGDKLWFREMLKILKN